MAEAKRRRDIKGLEDRFSKFVKESWNQFDRSQYQESWAIDALCEHLEAVSDGHIKKLLVNFPFRCGKTNVTSIAFPAWTWARRKNTFTSGPGVRFLCGSYNHDLALTNSTATRRLMLSPWYQERWGKRFGLREDQNTKTRFDNTEGGSRISTSVGGSLLGIGGDIILVDDPHNTAEVESEAERETVKEWWKELSTTRLNDPDRSAIVVIMQRLNEEDVSGLILDEDEDGSWTHLCIPMHYDSTRHCSTVVCWGADGQPAKMWEDPREEDGELMWPERVSEEKVREMERQLGPYMASGRLEQRPTPKQGAIFVRDWWELWESTDGKFPVFDYIVASLDSAFTEKEENDPSALTIWGTFLDKQRQRRIMLVNAWRKHLQFHGPAVFQEKGESDLHFRFRAQKSWGLVEWVSDTCRRFKVDRLLVENKASGISAAQELQRLYGREGWAIQLETPKGDKVARALAVQAMFANGLIYAPDRDWAEMVISEMEMFPKGRYDDLTDSATQALKHLRETGLAQLDAEVRFDEMEHARFKKPLKSLYPC